MSKKYKGMTCVYCCDAKSVTADHVFARKLFLVPRRANLPKVPACENCNRRKSELEHYVASVLPFGGRHNDAQENLRSMVPKRLAKNATLYDSLDKGRKRDWTQEKGLYLRMMSIPIRWHKIEKWLELVVKGLAWHHWKVLIGPDYIIDIIAMTPRYESFFRQFRMMRAADRISIDIGAGTFSYDAAQGVDNPKVSVWEFLIYGGVTFGEGLSANSQKASKIGVMVGPKTIFDRAEKKNNWL